ncbi:chorismate mutase [Litoreibacter arenae]|uniref:chorismate mutase n=1 Tax=Litoreibacter arenae DSM 19593 TaxID=1123360 RepID=S9QKC6_9RHOB|nr:chorismate mutase [Litoreibacter arenae]EPX80232.1 Isochorismate pyruvate-lyase [Litoreibacter arenae DSM 19593]
MTSYKPAQDCNSMAELRLEIDAIDMALVDLLARRAGYIDRAVDLKPTEGLPARIPARVNEVLANVSKRAAESGLDPQLAETLWTELIEWSIQRESDTLGG